MLGWLKRLFDDGQHPRFVGSLAGARALVINVQTTGIEPTDRVVTFAGLLLPPLPMELGTANLRYAHYVFDPERPVHPDAQDVHRWSNGLLAHQPKFAEEAEDIAQMIAAADLIVAHNAEFHVAFVDRDLAMAGLPPNRKPVYCTMVEHARLRSGGRATLYQCAKEIGLLRQSWRHIALEEAWLTARVFLRQAGQTGGFPLDAFPSLEPENYREPVYAERKRLPPRKKPAKPPAIAEPPLPTSSLSAPVPPITRRPGFRRNDYSQRAPLVEQLKREGRHEEAVAILLDAVEAIEVESRSTGGGVAPWFYEQLAIIYRRLARPEDELSILERFEAQAKLPGATPAKLAERLAKIRADTRIRRAVD